MTAISSSPHTPSLMVPIQSIQLTPGSTILIPGVSWEQFETLLAEVGDCRTYRLTYYQGMLEIDMPSEEHEFITRMIDILIRVLCRESGLNLKTMGSTTLKVQTLASSPEPDSGFYIQNELQVRGKRVNLSQDPPPDLVVEVNITHSDLNKKAMYAQMGVQEFWSYSGKTGLLTFHALERDSSSGNRTYQSVETSSTFPFIRQTTLQEFIQRCYQDGELQAEDWFRDWVMQQI